MTATKPERRHVVVITDETTREELTECLALLNDNAKRLSRRGFCGVRSNEYTLAHSRIDAVLAQLLATDVT